MGSQYTSGYFANSMVFYGVEVSHSWARSPECNGIIERFHRTIEKQLFAMHDFATLEEAEAAIREFVARYNREWQLERLNYKSPLEAMYEYENKGLKIA